MTIQLHPAQPIHRPTIIELLKASGLPTDDLPLADRLDHFVVALADNGLVGVAGLECWDSVALLRSVAVTRSVQRQGIAGQLTRHLLALARQEGVQAVYLLTTTAESYFERHDFVRIERQQAPVAIQLTGQFQSLCPASAVLMKRSL